MKIALAQINPISGDIEKNIVIHKNWIEKAAKSQADLIVFPELSLTGYEPGLVEKIAVEKSDSRLDELQKICKAKNISAAVGLPLKNKHGNMISMFIFQPDHDLTKDKEAQPHENPRIPGA